MLNEQVHEAGEKLANLAASHRDHGGLVLLPDEVTEASGTAVAGFRPEAQSLQAAALQQDIDVMLAKPEGALLGEYTAHSAEWVLPMIAIPPSVVATLIANHVQEWLDHARKEQRSETPTVRYREVESRPDGSSCVRELEGPAEELVAWLEGERQAAELERSPDDPPAADQ